MVGATTAHIPSNSAQTGQSLLKVTICIAFNCPTLSNNKKSPISQVFCGKQRPDCPGVNETPSVVVRMHLSVTIAVWIKQGTHWVAQQKN